MAFSSSFLGYFSVFSEFSRVLGGVQGSTGGRGAAPSGTMVISHFQLKIMIFLCVYCILAFSAAVWPSNSQLIDLLPSYLTGTFEKGDCKGTFGGML